jgi:nitrogen fixation/metabolism regulation signal transduction histidine kinase
MEFSSKKTCFFILVKFKNSLAAFYSIGTIVFISLATLIIYDIGLLNNSFNFCTIIPIITCILYLLLIIIVRKAIKKLEKVQDDSRLALRKKP